MEQVILVAEDDHNQCNLIHTAIQNAYPLWSVYDAYDLKTAQSLIEDEGILFSLFLLDVRLSENEDDRSGFQLAESLRQQQRYYATPILFLTSVYDQTGFALSQFHCYNYITKPYSSTNIIQQIRQMLLTGFLNNSLSICDIARVHHNIFPEEVLYVSSKGHVIDICTEHGCIQTREYNLTEMLQLLNGPFIQIHRKHLVNRNKIKSIDLANMLLSIGSVSLPIGRTYRSSLSTELGGPDKI